MVIDAHLKVIVFDFDGTLFHLDLDWQDLKQRLGVHDSEQNLGSLIQYYIDEKHPNLQQITDVELAAIGDKRLDSITLAVLSQIAQRHQLAIFTRNSRLAVAKTLEGSELAETIYIVGREDTAHLKPNPEGLHQIIDHFNVMPADAALVGDTSHDVEAARAAGMKSIIVANPQLAYQPKDADQYVVNLTELIAA